MKIGIIGFGQFGQFITKHIEQYADVRIFDVRKGKNKRLSSLQEVCDSDIVVFAVPAQNFEVACESAKPYIGNQTLIIDVSSVKVRPIEILKKYFPNNEILGTHPIFGPQSGKNGIEGLPIVLCNLSWSKGHYSKVKSFLSKKLGLKVIERTAKEHDKEMARVQGLAHFIGRALKTLDIKNYETSTQSYNNLVELKNLLKNDSWELFETIQKENPYAVEVREEFLQALSEIESKLEDQ
jgi:prephenate dehydrogenase